MILYIFLDAHEKRASEARGRKEKIFESSSGGMVCRFSFDGSATTREDADVHIFERLTNVSILTLLE